MARLSKRQREQAEQRAKRKKFKRNLLIGGGIAAAAGVGLGTYAIAKSRSGTPATGSTSPSAAPPVKSETFSDDSFIKEANLDRRTDITRYKQSNIQRRLDANMKHDRRQTKMENLAESVSLNEGDMRKLQKATQNEHVLKAVNPVNAEAFHQRHVKPMVQQYRTTNNRNKMSKLMGGDRINDKTKEVLQSLGFSGGGFAPGTSKDKKIRATRILRNLGVFSSSYFRNLTAFTRYSY